MNRFLEVIIGFSIIFSLLLLVSCTNPYDVSEKAREKASSELLEQVKLREIQIAEPTAERLEVMKATGMRVDNLGSHRIFIHFNQKPSQSQVGELEAIGLTLYLDSWIPPVGNHPTGYILADMPVNKLEELADKDYVVRLETAERQLEPHGGSQPQGG